MAEILNIDINTRQNESVLEKYNNTSGLELLMVLGKQHKVTPKDQQQTSDNVQFNDSVVEEAKNELVEK
jgi:hypothetical protein